MARVLPVLCALLFFVAFVVADTPLSSNVRSVTFNSLDKQITYTVTIDNDATVTVPTFVITLDGSQEDNSLDINPDTLSMDITVDVNVKYPVQSKTKKNPPSKKPTQKPTPKPSVSAAFGTEFSPLMAFVSLAAAALCRGLTQNNKMSFGLFILVALIFASVESDAAKTFEAKKVNIDFLLPLGWTASETLPFDKKITKDFDVSVAPPSPTPSNTATRSVAASSSVPATRSASISVSPM
eukprot:TRINITY_DN204_c0_g1_i2.p1 TRINITY_DN204_c0_g1~~TRINITY_DN204_c0_g1_i2.p1  ORF type:complete len:239 (+),score=52.12 TRINITY_DN204_c0_g1_i2:205-921(+)